MANNVIPAMLGDRRNFSESKFKGGTKKLSACIRNSYETDFGTLLTKIELIIQVPTCRASLGSNWWIYG
jgi:hypothetical protein